MSETRTRAGEHAVSYETSRLQEQAKREFWDLTTDAATVKPGEYGDASIERSESPYGPTLTTIKSHEDNAPNIVFQGVGARGKPPIITIDSLDAGGEWRRVSLGIGEDGEVKAYQQDVDYRGTVQWTPIEYTQSPNAADLVSMVSHQANYMTHKRPMNGRPETSNIGGAFDTVRRERWRRSGHVPVKALTDNEHEWLQSPYGMQDHIDDIVDETEAAARAKTLWVLDDNSIRNSWRERAAAINEYGAARKEGHDRVAFALNGYDGRRFSAYRPDLPGGLSVPDELNRRAKMVDAAARAIDSNDEASSGWQELPNSDKEDMAYLLSRTWDTAKGLEMAFGPHARTFKIAQRALRSAYKASHGKTKLGRDMAELRKWRNEEKLRKRFVKHGVLS
jgi:hypothetical protein